MQLKSGLLTTIISREIKKPRWNWWNTAITNALPVANSILF
jgi:hypothetical protein